MKALALWRGEAYAEFADEDWARPEAQRLGELRVVAYERLVDAELACGRAAEVIPQIESLAAEHPLREAFRAQLMIALYRTGRQADALRVVRDYRQRARRGARPGAVAGGGGARAADPHPRPDADARRAGGRAVARLPAG